MADLKNSIAWWLEPALADRELSSMPQANGMPAARKLFPDMTYGVAPSALENIRKAARNRLMVLVSYNGTKRLIEPYSLRYLATGNQNLHVWEVEKNGRSSNIHKTYTTNQLKYLSTSNQTFVPKWKIEL